MLYNFVLLQYQLEFIYTLLKMAIYLSIYQSIYLHVSIYLSLNVSVIFYLCISYAPPLLNIKFWNIKFYIFWLASFVYLFSKCSATSCDTTVQLTIEMTHYLYL